MSVQVGDVRRSRMRFGQRSVRNVCPGCRCYVREDTRRCPKCRIEFTPVTEGFAQVTSLGGP